MTISDNGYELRILNGTLLINGTVAEDFLDCLDRTYTATTSSQVNVELQRLFKMAWDRSAEAKEIELREGVPVVGDVR